jgi:RNA polymerase sigma factor (sigma-70 family)
MRLYPSGGTQKRICDFYRHLGIFLFEEDVFPKELQNIKSKRYIAEKRIPKTELISLQNVDRRLLPLIDKEEVEWGIERKIEGEKLKEWLDEALSRLPYRRQRILRMRYFDEMTYKEIGDAFHVTEERVRQIEENALRKLRMSRSNRLNEFI